MSKVYKCWNKNSPFSCETSNVSKSPTLSRGGDILNRLPDAIKDVNDTNQLMTMTVIGQVYLATTQYADIIPTYFAW